MVSGVLSGQTGAGVCELLSLKVRSVRQTGQTSAGGEHGGNAWAGLVSAARLDSNNETHTVLES